MGQAEVLFMTCSHESNACMGGCPPQHRSPIILPRFLPQADQKKEGGGAYFSLSVLISSTWPSFIVR